MERWELLQEAIKGNIAVGDRFRCSNKGSEIEFDGTMFKYISGFKHGSKLYLATTSVTEDWAYKPKTTHLRVEVPVEFMDELREHQFKYDYKNLSEIVQKSGKLLMGVEKA